MSHAAALRCLGKRWLKLLWRLWQDRVAYDPNTHLKSLQEHASWVLKLMSLDPAPDSPAL